MGNKSQRGYESIIPDEKLADFNDITSNEDAIKWMQAHFDTNSMTSDAISLLQDPNMSLRIKSYRHEHENNSDYIIIRFELIDCRTPNGWPRIISFQYSHSIKS